MTEATSWRGKAALWYRVAGHQSDHFHSRGISIREGAKGGRIQRHMATGARGQGAIQSNEIALGRGKKRKRMMREGGREGWREGEREGGKGSRKYYIILCIPPQDHGNSLIRTTSVPAVQWQGFSSLLKQNCKTAGKGRFLWIVYMLGSSTICTH